MICAEIILFKLLFLDIATLIKQRICESMWKATGYFIYQKLENIC